MNYNSREDILGILFKEIEILSDKYEFLIMPDPQGNSVYLRKDGIELYDYGGHVSLVTAITKCFEYLYRINKTPKEKTVFYKIEKELP